MGFKTVMATFFSISLMSADTLILHNGSRIEGHFIGGSDQTIQFAIGGRVNTFNVSDIDSLRFSPGQSAYSPGAAQPSPYPPQAQQMPPPSVQSPAGGYPPIGQNAPPPVGNSPDSNPATAVGPPQGMQIPAGTSITVRLIDPVNSEADSLGQTYRASVDQPVFVDGQAVIPRGADVVAALIDAQKSGKIQGRTVLTLDLKSVTLNGHSYDIVTTGVPQASDSRGKRSTEVIGGTAALGAIIGAIAGGGKGAAIGAGSGAAVGAAGQVLTSGQKVKIPAETRISFTLQNPLTL